MTNSVQRCANNVLFLAILALSALSMVWLFWNHPLKTSIVTLVILAIFWVSAHLARAVETDSEESELN